MTFKNKKNKMTEKNLKITKYRDNNFNARCNDTCISSHKTQSISYLRAFPQGKQLRTLANEPPAM